MKIRGCYKFFVNIILTAAALALMLMPPPVGAQTPFEVFLGVMKKREPYSRTETGEGGYVYRLDGGILSITLGNGTEIWRSSRDWWIDDFRLGDVDGDGIQDVLFTLWKSYRFGQAKPARMENSDERVRNHLFLYTVMPGYVKEVWCSSDLPRPIYRFELDPTGDVTPVSSGMLLWTEEGEYSEDFYCTETAAHKYAWEGWGFVEAELPVS